MPNLAASFTAASLLLLPLHPAATARSIDTTAPILLARKGNDGFRTWEVRRVRGQKGDIPMTESAIADLDRFLKDRLRLPDDVRGSLTMQVHIYQGRIIETLVKRSDRDLTNYAVLLPLQGQLMKWRIREPLNGYFELRLRTVPFREEEPTPPIPDVPNSR